MLRISNIKTKVKHTQGNIKKEIAEILKMEMKDVPEFTIAAKSIDARNKGNVMFVYSVDIELENEHLFLELNNVRTVEEYKYSIEKITTKAKRPIVVGSGPAGIFAALVLAEAGLKPIIIERGKNVDERMKDVDD
ncbi:MAG: FAD-binding protein, partial [Leptotrichiaceae bacterium]